MRFGVDEAGKGPVLGSMFAAAVLADPVTLPAAVGDSKGIAPERRASLASEIRDRARAVGVAEVPVPRIDDPATDMNSLTAAAHAEALATALDAAALPRSDLEGELPAIAGTVDAADTDADRFGRRVAERVDAPVALEAAHGADASEPLVGAASIVAKEAREAHVASLAERFGDVGSGYPSDPLTRTFLETWIAEHGDAPPCARSSWATTREALAAAEQADLGEF